MQIADAAAIYSIEHARWIRRLISGDSDIEGDWVNVVINTSDPHKLIYAEYCRMRYANGSYSLSGDTWTINGRWVGSFTTSGSNYRNRQFEYYYEAGLNRVGGYGVIIYTPRDALPTDFICRYIDETLGAPHVARGRRVSRQLNNVEFDKRRDAALAFARDFDRDGLLDIDAALGHRPTP
jgi:hypothetical protein